MELKNLVLTVTKSPKIENVLYSHIHCYIVLRDTIHNGAVEGSDEYNSLAYGYIFSARHCIELGLKVALSAAKVNFPMLHDLLQLYDLLIAHDPSYLNQLRDFKPAVNYFNSLDPTSYTFRYGIDKHMNQIIQKDLKFRIKDIDELLEKFSKCLWKFVRKVNPAMVS